METVFRHYRVHRNRRYHPSYGNSLLAHYRRGKAKNGNPWEPQPKGGMTICFIVDDEGNVVNVGVALCSLKDNFCYQIGRDKARDRAEEGKVIAWPSWAEGVTVVDGYGYTVSTNLSDMGICTLMLNIHGMRSLARLNSQ